MFKIKKLIEKYLKSDFTKNILRVVSGNSFAKILAFALTPIITRIYSPDDYGVFSIFISLIAVTGAIITLRLSAAIPIEKNRNNLHNLIGICM